MKQLKKNGNKSTNGQTLEVTERNYYFGIYHVAVIIAHELCHVDTGYMTGSFWPRTPDRVTAGGHELPNVHGEHGWAWENKLFKGCTVFYKDDQDPYGDKQAGVPYAYVIQKDKDNKPQKIFYKYVEGYVSSVANFSKSNPYYLTFSNHTF